MQETPPHYRGTAIIDFWKKYKLEACHANAMKYVLRYREKGQPIQDLKKAMDYLNQAPDYYSHCPEVVLGGRSEEMDMDLQEIFKDYNANHFQRRFFTLRKKYAIELIREEIARLEREQTIKEKENDRLP